MSSRKAVVERYLEGFRRSDHEMVLSSLTDDVEWDMPNAFQLSGKAAFDKEIENDAFVGSPTITIHRMLEDDDCVIAEGNVHGQFRDGGRLNARFCDLFDFDGDLIRRVTTYQPMVEPAART